MAQQYVVVFTKPLISAQQMIIELRLTKAEQQIREEKIKNPANLACDYLLGYVDFYRVITSQKKAHFNNFKELCLYNNNQYNKLSDDNA